MLSNMADLHYPGGQLYIAQWQNNITRRGQSYVVRHGRPAFTQGISCILQATDVPPAKAFQQPTPHWAGSVQRPDSSASDAQTEGTDQTSTGHAAQLSASEQDVHSSSVGSADSTPAVAVSMNGSQAVPSQAAAVTVISKATAVKVISEAAAVTERSEVVVASIMSEATAIIIRSEATAITISSEACAATIVEATAIPVADAVAGSAGGMNLLPAGQSSADALQVSSCAHSCEVNDNVSLACGAVAAVSDTRPANLLTELADDDMVTDAATRAAAVTTAPAESAADMMSKGSIAVQLAVRAADPADASTQSANVPREAGACIPVPPSGVPATSTDMAVQSVSSVLEAGRGDRVKAEGSDRVTTSGDGATLTVHAVADSAEAAMEPGGRVTDEPDLPTAIRSAMADATVMFAVSSRGGIESDKMASDPAKIVLSPMEASKESVGSFAESGVSVTSLGPKGLGAAARESAQQELDIAATDVAQQGSGVAATESAQQGLGAMISNSTQQGSGVSVTQIAQQGSSFAVTEPAQQGSGSAATELTQQGSGATTTELAQQGTFAAVTESAQQGSGTAVADLTQQRSGATTTELAQQPSATHLAHALKSPVSVVAEVVDTLPAVTQTTRDSAGGVESAIDSTESAHGTDSAKIVADSAGKVVGQSEDSVQAEASPSDVPGSDLHKQQDISSFKTKSAPATAAQVWSGTEQGVDTQSSATARAAQGKDDQQCQMHCPAGNNVEAMIEDEWLTTSARSGARHTAAQIHAIQGANKGSVPTGHADVPHLLRSGIV